MEIITRGQGDSTNEQKAAHQKIEQITKWQEDQMMEDMAHKIVVVII